MRQSSHLCPFAIPLLVLCASLVSCHGTATRGSPPPPAPALSLSTGGRLAVIGVKQGEGRVNDANGGGAQSRRIGFGLNSLMAESLFDSGKFQLVEEKDVRKRELIEDLVYTYWVERRDHYAEEELHRVAIDLGVELLAYGTISYTGSTGQKIMIGPFGSYQQELRVGVSVCLYEASTRAIRCREGQGKAHQEGVGVIYEFRQDRLDLEKSAAGRATKQAVTSAVQALVASIHFSS
jgi:hypothetical protein